MRSPHPQKELAKYSLAFADSVAWPVAVSLDRVACRVSFFFGWRMQTQRRAFLYAIIQQLGVVETG